MKNIPLSGQKPGGVVTNMSAGWAPRPLCRDSETLETKRMNPRPDGLLGTLARKAVRQGTEALTGGTCHPESPASAASARARRPWRVSWGCWASPPPATWRSPSSLAVFAPAPPMRAFCGRQPPPEGLFLSQQPKKNTTGRGGSRQERGARVLQPTALFPREHPAQCQAQHEFPSFPTSWSGGFTPILRLLVTFDLWHDYAEIFKTKNKLKINQEASPTWHSRNESWLGTMRLRVRSLAFLSGLRIRHCHELWCMLQMPLGSHVAISVGRWLRLQLDPWPGNCHMLGEQPKKQQKDTHKKRCQVFPKKSRNLFHFN